MSPLIRIAALALALSLPAFAAPSLVPQLTETIPAHHYLRITTAMDTDRSPPVRLNLLVNASATQTAPPYVEWPGGVGDFSVVGTFNGATVKLQVLGPDENTWLDVGTSTTFTAAGHGLFTLPTSHVRAAVTGGPPSGVYASAGLMQN